MKKYSLSMLASAMFMIGALFATTTSANACGRTYATACVVVRPEPVRIVYIKAKPKCHSHCCHSHCAPVKVCRKKWRTKTIKVWDPVQCCYVYKKVRRYRTVCTYK